MGTIRRFFLYFLPFYKLLSNVSSLFGDKICVMFGSRLYYRLNGQMDSTMVYPRNREIQNRDWYWLGNEWIKRNSTIIVWHKSIAGNKIFEWMQMVPETIFKEQIKPLVALSGKCVWLCLSKQRFPRVPIWFEHNLYFPYSRVRKLLSIGQTAWNFFELTWNRKIAIT